MYCPFCGAKNSSDTTHCVACGADLRKEQNAVSNRPSHNEAPQYSPPDPPHQPEPKKTRLSKGVIVLIVSISVVAIVAIITLVIQLASRTPEPPSETLEAVKQVENKTPVLEEIEQKSEGPSNSQSTSEQNVGSQNTDDSSRTTKDLECKGVVCQVPRLWIVKAEEDGSVMAHPYSVDKIVIMQHMPLEGLEQYDLADIAVAYALSDSSDTLGDTEIVGEPISKMLDNDSFEAIRVESIATIADKSSGTRYHFIDQWIKTENSFLIMQVVCEEEQWEAEKDELFKVLDSVHIPDPALAGTENGYIIQDDKVQS